MKYIVELEPGVWLDHGTGDPPRTQVEAFAVRFSNQSWAETRLAMARAFRPFANAKIVEVTE